MTRYKLVRRPPESERLRVCAWLEKHGIDPNDVDQYGWIETRHSARQVAWLGFVWETAGDGGRQIKLTGSGAEREVRVLQLESPPMPFPSGITCVEAS